MAQLSKLPCCRCGRPEEPERLTEHYSFRDRFWLGWSHRRLRFRFVRPTGGRVLGSEGPAAGMIRVVSLAGEVLFEKPARECTVEWIDYEGDEEVHRGGSERP